MELFDKNLYVTKEVRATLTDEEYEAFLGTDEYFNTFDKNKNGKIINVLPKKEELKLGRILEEYKCGNEDLIYKARAAYNKLFKYNQIKVFQQVRQFINKDTIFYYEMEEAIQDCLLELHRGIMEYDTSKDCGLYTRVYYMVHKKLSTESNRARPIPLPSNAGYKSSKIKDIINEYEEENGITPCADEIIELMREKNDMKLTHTELVGLTNSTSGIASTDFVIGDNESKEITLGDTIGDECQDYSRIEATDIIDNLCKDIISDDDKQLLYFSYGMDSAYNNLTEKELASEIGITINELRKKVSDIILKLQNIAKERGITI